MAVVANSSPLTARRRLGQELRVLRDRAALTTEDVGTHLNCHNSKISRMELGKRGCTKRDFDALMDLFEVEGAKREELAELFRKGRQRIPPWWQAYADVISANYAEFLAYEAEATRCWEYQPLLIPGLLQTADYAHSVTGVGFGAFGPEQIDSLVEVRVRRQERLREGDPLILEAVITEAALRLQVGGPEVIRGQLRHLVEVASMDNLSLRVIPFTAGEKATSTGAFRLFGTENGGDADVAFTESADETLTLKDEPLALRRLKRLFRNLSAAALPAEDSVALIDRIEKELI